jgi:N-acyl-D-aspartate/D-glutamate deacylase
VVTGNCGFGFPKAEEWFEKIRSWPFGSNVAHLTPHGMIRLDLFGPDQPETLTPRQLDRLTGRIGEEMDKGAVGVSFGLEYAPGLLAQREELAASARAAARKGGLAAVHLRDEAGGVRPGRPGVLSAIEETIDVARRAEARLQISHLKIAAPFGGLEPERILEPIEKAREYGLDVTVDQYPYDAGSSPLTYLIPGRFKSGFGVRNEYRVSAGRAELVQACRDALSQLEPEKILIVMYPEKTHLEGRTLKDIGELENRPPAESLTDMLLEPEAPMGVYFHQDMRVVLALMTRPYVMTGSDSRTVPLGQTQIHPRAYGTFARKIRLTRDLNLMPAEAVIRSMTSLPAEKFGLTGRGRLEPGKIADLAVLDWAGVNDPANYQNPHQYASGLVHLFMAGRLVVENGRPTGLRNGQVLTGGGR